MDMKVILNLLEKNGLISSEDKFKNLTLRRWQHEKDFDSHQVKNPFDNPPIWIDVENLENFPDWNYQNNKAETEGMEALAWYRSFHFTPQNNWGIYITESGIYSLASKVFYHNKLQNKHGRIFNIIDYVKLAYHLLLLHETYHFFTDLAATTLELSNQEKKIPNYYLNYFYHVYQRSANGPLEEALANAFAYTRFFDTITMNSMDSISRKKVNQSMRGFMKNQPAGYRNFEQFITRNSFEQANSDLVATILRTSPSRGIPPYENILNPTMRGIRKYNIPVYIVKDAPKSSYGIKFVQSIPNSSIFETSRFQKEYKKIQKKRSDMIKAYKKSKGQLNTDVSLNSLNFEKLTGCDKTFTFRINDDYRVSLIQKGGNWHFLRIGSHDDIYRNPPCNK
ncbi:hypothetical protein GCM10011351_28380 [Paraliobacillus quinghaiensis]|uniref:Uncharacterized protein n=1 Tax=Paraliobacillus quinghaiensis TaxID=470815 RepID=A0A917TVZ4_9BACI|nr:hypothetical protein [Paraliobacillus quinghaiensis]GGM40533.1 hypothetical protein GCM10011351_28380 [Paraliobacillus quinghaiensis]